MNQQINFKFSCKIIKKLRNTYCRIKVSKIHGVGVFAIKDIPANTNPFYGCYKKKWVKFKIEELKKARLDKEIMAMIDDFLVIQKNGNVYIAECGLNGMDISFFLNDSKNPNVITTNDGSSFVTKRKIKKGEELTVAYSTYDEKYN